MEATVALSASFTAGLTYSYMNTEIKSDFFVSTLENPWRNRNIAENVNTRGNDLNRSPRDKVSAWATYRVPLGNNGRLTFFASYAYMGERYYDVLNYRINQVPAFDRWDARMIWESVTGMYRVTGFVKNVADELGIVMMRPTQRNFGRTADTTAPRAWGLEVRVRFGNWGSRGAEILDGIRHL